LVADFSTLELHLEEQSEHRFGSLLMCLFRMRRIRAAAKRLKVVVPPRTEVHVLKHFLGSTRSLQKYIVILSILL
jgi:hypothetical protein